MCCESPSDASVLEETSVCSRALLQPCCLHSLSAVSAGGALFRRPGQDTPGYSPASQKHLINTEHPCVSPLLAPAPRWNFLGVRVVGVKVSFVTLMRWLLESSGGWRGLAARSPSLVLRGLELCPPSPTPALGGTGLEGGSGPGLAQLGLVLSLVNTRAAPALGQTTPACHARAGCGHRAALCAACASPSGGRASVRSLE